jgi:hypothetical protein
MKKARAGDAGRLHEVTMQGRNQDLCPRGGWAGPGLLHRAPFNVELCVWFLI